MRVGRGEQSNARSTKTNTESVPHILPEDGDDLLVLGGFETELARSGATTSLGL